jgi:hypothetical protein
VSFPNSSVSDIIASSIEQRSKEIADNVTDNNAFLKRLEQKGNIRTADGGRLIYEELSFAENGNGTWFDGYDELPVGPQDVISAAEFNWKQYAVAVTISGREMIQNSGKAKMFDLLDARLGVAEATAKNAISAGLYSDGTGSGGKILTGLDAAVPADPTTGTYGGINRATASNVFWRSQVTTATTSAANVQAQMNGMWAKTVRGSDRPDLILMGSTFWAFFTASLQLLQRFSGTETGKLGFPTIKFMDADCVLDGGIGGNATATNAYFLNTSYLHYRPHVDTNMVAGKKRMSFNQDASAEILLWAGNLTCSGAQFQGRITGA